MNVSVSLTNYNYTIFPIKDMVDSVNDKKILGISECGCYIGEPQSGIIVSTAGGVVALRK